MTLETRDTQWECQPSYEESLNVGVLASVTVSKNLSQTEDRKVQDLSSDAFFEDRFSFAPVQFLNVFGKFGPKEESSNIHC